VLKRRRDDTGAVLPGLYDTVPCPCTEHEPEEEREERLWRLSHITGPDRLRRFAGFNLQEAPGMQAAYDAAHAWATDPDAKPFLILIGPKGVGKTHLALAAAAACIARGEPVAYCITPLLLDELRATQRRQPEGEPPPPTLESARRRPLSYPSVVLDDLGAGRETEFGAEQLYTIINERWRLQRRTLVTTNVAPERIEERVRSRLLDWQVGVAVACEGSDYRRFGNRQRRARRTA